MTDLEPRILYRDSSIVLVDKPPGLLVHPTAHDRGAPTCLWMLSDSLGVSLRTVHRIDRATSGLVLFAATQESASLLAAQFRDRSVDKGYLAIVRGHLPAPRLIDEPVARHLGDEPVRACTFVTPLSRAVLHEPVGRYDEGWFSLVAIDLLTGRMHQARKHLHHIDHPVIGDKKHGDRAQNRFFVERFGAGELYLRAYRLRFRHPATGAVVEACSGLPPSWLRIAAALGLEMPSEIQREASIRLGCPV